MTPSIPASFEAKKQKILAALSVPESEYSDNSPKGSVDEPIKELIDLINSYPGWCTTSSCSGRVAVFVEGPKHNNDDDTTNISSFLNQNYLDELDNESNNNDHGGGDHDIQLQRKSTAKKKVIKTGPGGKGGGHWLFVSHTPLANTENIDQLNIIQPELSADDTERKNRTATDRGPSSRELVHLSFSPLILHILCASLDHAKPLLAAAINAGFRESGVPSLKVLEEPEKGVMVAIRTTGLTFSSVVGVFATGGDGGRVRAAGKEQKLNQEHDEAESRRVVVSDEYLRMCLSVTNERFKANEERKKRLEEEIRKIVVFGQQEKSTKNKKISRQGADGEWESKEDRRRRKREEGLRRQTQNGERTRELCSKVIADDDVDVDDALLDLNLDKMQ